MLKYEDGTPASTPQMASDVSTFLDFIENAHWWGQEGAKYTNGYFICESLYDFDELFCFNLVDNPEHLKLFNETKELMQLKGLYQIGVTTVSRIIKFIKDTLKVIVVR